MNSMTSPYDVDPERIALLLEELAHQVRTNGIAIKEISTTHALDAKRGERTYGVDIDFFQLQSTKAVDELVYQIKSNSEELDDPIYD